MYGIPIRTQLIAYAIYGLLAFGAYLVYHGCTK